MESFLFYDLETFGIDSSFSRVSQFAAIRTDMDLNPIGDPMDWLIKPASDVLPSPQSCLITHVNPWETLAKGSPEFEVVARIHEQMSEPGTCTLGYNSYRFDDAFMRNAFYRNFWPMYRREYENGNSRWDLLNVFRAAYVLRPDSLVWPLNDKGVVSFKLEDLAIANDARDGMAHEALSDVRALVGLARKLKDSQPKFWEYVFSLRQKSMAQRLLDAPNGQIVLHIQSFYGFDRQLCAPLLPLFRHPQQSNDVVVFDLGEDPQQLLDWNSFEERAPGLETVRVNDAPMLFQWQHIREDERERLTLDSAIIEQRAKWLQDNQHRIPFMRMMDAMSPAYKPPEDVDAAMYGGFFSATDERWMSAVRSTAPAQLSALEDVAGINSRLPELLKRYRARNFPDTLSFEEVQAWKEFCTAKFSAPENGTITDMNFAAFSAQLAELRALENLSAEQRELLDEVERFGQYQVDNASVV